MTWNSGLSASVYFPQPVAEWEVGDNNLNNHASTRHLPNAFPADSHSAIVMPQILPHTRCCCRYDPSLRRHSAGYMHQYATLLQPMRSDGGNNSTDIEAEPSPSPQGEHDADQVRSSR